MKRYTNKVTVHGFTRMSDEAIERKLFYASSVRDVLCGIDARGCYYRRSQDGREFLALNQRCHEAKSMYGWFLGPCRKVKIVRKECVEVEVDG